MEGSAPVRTKAGRKPGAILPKSARLAWCAGKLVAYYKVDGVRKRRSLGTSDVDEARKRLSALTYKARDNHKGHFIYFVQMDNPDGFIKIGYCTNVGVRISNLKVSCPYNIKILAVINGRQETEERIHRILEDHRVKGEWFRPHYHVTAFIDTIIKDGGHDIQEMFWPHITSRLPPPLEVRA